MLFRLTISLSLFLFIVSISVAHVSYTCTLLAKCVTETGSINSSRWWGGVGVWGRTSVDSGSRVSTLGVDEPAESRGIRPREHTFIHRIIDTTSQHIYKNHLRTRWFLGKTRKPDDSLSNLNHIFFSLFHLSLLRESLNFYQIAH